MSESRILIVTPEYPPTVLGGVGRYAWEFAQEASKRVQMTVLHAPSYALAIPTDADRMVHDGMVEVFRTAPLLTGAQDTDPASQIVGMIREAEVRLKGSELRNAGPWDLAYVQDYGNAPYAAAIRSLKLASRTIGACHLPLYAGFTYFDRSITDDMHQSLESLLVRVCDQVITPSHYAARILRMTYNVMPHRIVASPFGVRRPIATAPLPTDDALRLIVLGRFTEQKGLHHLPELSSALACRGVAHQFTLLGPPRGRERAINVINLRKPAVREGAISFASERTHDDVWAALDEHHALVTPSNYETFGFAPLEAMASARPAFGFALGALRELTGDLNDCLLAPIGDIEALAGLIASWARDRSTRHVLSEACASRAEAFSWERHVDEVLGRCAVVAA